MLKPRIDHSPHDSNSIIVLQRLTFWPTSPTRTITSELFPFTTPTPNFSSLNPMYREVWESLIKQRQREGNFHPPSTDCQADFSRRLEPPIDISSMCSIIHNGHIGIEMLTREPTRGRAELMLEKEPVMRMWISPMLGVNRLTSI